MEYKYLRVRWHVGRLVAGPSALVWIGLSASFQERGCTSGDGEENPGGGMEGRPDKLV